MASSTSACTVAISSSRLGTVSSKVLGSSSGMRFSNMRLFIKSIEHANLTGMQADSSDRVEITPAIKIQGDITMPGDKSISHRLAMVGSIADGQTTIENFASSADSHATLNCLGRLGVLFHEVGSTVT